MHLNPLNEEHSTGKHKIIVAFHIYSNFDKHCILSHSILFGFKFRVILLFWVVEICSQMGIPVKEMFVCLPPPPPDTTITVKNIS